MEVCLYVNLTNFPCYKNHSILVWGTILYMSIQYLSSYIIVYIYIYIYIYVYIREVHNRYVVPFNL